MNKYFFFKSKDSNIFLIIISLTTNNDLGIVFDQVRFGSTSFAFYYFSIWTNMSFKLNKYSVTMLIDVTWFCYKIIYLF